MEPHLSDIPGLVTEKKIETIRSEQKRKFFLFISGILLLIIALGYYEIFLPHSSYLGIKHIEISPGLGSRQIGELLRKEGVINSKWIFVAYVSTRGVASILKPGKYTFGRVSIADIARDLTLGASRERTITIPEGWTVKEIGKYLEEENIISAKEFIDVATSSTAELNELFPFLKEKPIKLGLEGYLFPDTYRIYQDSAPQDIVKRMLQNWDNKVTPDLRKEIARQGKNLFQILTMASLIEKEVVGEKDRTLVSGILWKRLSLEIPLQVDATLVYIKNQKSKIGDRNALISADKLIDSPYNTYKYRGLPLGPIANPGLSAIKTAIYPQVSSYLYYLSARDGRTIFSKTLEEHNEAKDRYLRE